ncbi:MAG: hypothetical protein LUE89_06290 [Clostridiales bacterium]|nr:hypothetical protein [Clostridiales bacterium]
MNNAETAIEKAGRLQALLYALEVIAIKIDVEPKDGEMACKASNLLFMAEEVTEDLVKSLEQMGRDAAARNPVHLAYKIHDGE